jgi:uncharacterized protein
MPRSKARPSRNDLAPPSRQAKISEPVEVIDPAWLVGALAACVAAALVCAWLAVCLLFYIGEWQLVLHPSRTVDATPANAGLAFEAVRFDAAETGQPRLTGWWIAAEPAAKYSAFSVLYLHDGSGSLSACVPALARLHQAGLNVFAIDYRGFGASDASEHPTEVRMAEDTAAAFEYLKSTRHVAARNIISYGDGLGASLAVNLATQHTEIPVVIVEDPDPNPTATAAGAHPSRVVPIGLLFREHFEIAAPLAGLATPKLLIASSSGPDAAAVQKLFRSAASPSFAVTLPAKNPDQGLQNALARFLDEYLPAASLR